MTNKQLEIFKESVYKYSQRFKLCFWANTGESYPKTFCRLRYWRFVDELESKYNIEVKNTDEKSYNIYEEIMLNEINKFIDECKVNASNKAKEEAKNKQIRRKKGN